MGTPFGTAHETSTPSRSSRKSQWSRRAWCSWTTNRGALVSLRRTLAPGSGVRLKSLLASYSASFLAIRKTLGYGRFLFVDGHAGSLLATDENRRRRREHQHDDREDQGRVHRVNEGVGEDPVSYRLHRRGQLQAGARLSCANLESRVRRVAEAVDERLLELRRQLARSGHGPVVHR